MITNAERTAMRARYENRGSATTADIASMVCEDVPALLDALDEVERQRDAALVRIMDLERIWMEADPKTTIGHARDRARLDGARAMQEAIKARCQCVARHEFGMVAQALADEIASIDPATVGTR